MFVATPLGLFGGAPPCGGRFRGVRQTAAWDADPDVVSATKERIEGRYLSDEFRAGFKAEVNTPGDLAETTAALLDRRILELIGLARSAGAMAVGWEQAREFGRSRRVGLVVIASDAGPHSQRRMTGLAPDAPVLDMFDGETLGRAVGRDRAVNALVEHGKIADTLIRLSVGIEDVDDLVEDLDQALG